MIKGLSYQNRIVMILILYRTNSKKVVHYLA
ncbi:hypothetical protein VP277E431_P0250 [Vibrio phage 277E43-1]|nr:hypothetical protein VP277E431_P0250 [Vibrio phage 277E43-1]